MDTQQQVKDLKGQLLEIANRKEYLQKLKKDKWLQCDQPRLIDISVNEFWGNFYADDAVYP